jgi:hypothetical protein
MVLLDATAPRLTCLQVLDLSGAATGAVLDLIVGAAAGHLEGRAGFLGACWLVRGADSSVEHAGGRLLEYSQWAGRDHLDSSTAAAPRLPPEVAGTVEQRRLDTYRLDAVITSTGGSRMSLEADDPRVTMVVMMSPTAGQQGEVNIVNQDDTRDFFATYEGFVGTAFHLADGSDEVVECVQWQSAVALRAAAADPRFGAHLETLGRLCSSEVGMYDVHRTLRPALPSPSTARRAVGENRGA